MKTETLEKNPLNVSTEIHEVLSVNTPKVKRKYKHSGTSRTYSEEELEILSNSKYSTTDIAKYLKRNAAAVANKRYTLGIKGPGKGKGEKIVANFKVAKNFVVSVSKSSKVPEVSKPVIKNQIELNLNGMLLYIPSDTKSISVMGNNYNIFR